MKSGDRLIKLNGLIEAGVPRALKAARLRALNGLYIWKNKYFPRQRASRERQKVEYSEIYSTVNIINASIAHRRVTDCIHYLYLA